VNSKQVNGGALQKDAFTARLLLYVYVGYPLPPTPPPKKLAGSASISGMVSGKSGVDHPVATPLPTIGSYTNAILTTLPIILQTS